MLEVVSMIMGRFISKLMKWVVGRILVYLFIMLWVTLSDPFGIILAIIFGIGAIFYEFGMIAADDMIDDVVDVDDDVNEVHDVAENV